MYQCIFLSADNFYDDSKRVCSCSERWKRILESYRATVPAVKCANSLNCNTSCGIACSGNKMYCAMTSGNSDGSRRVVIQKYASFSSEKADDTVLLRGYYNHPNNLTTDSKSL